jgi:hypothetical protein
MREMLEHKPPIFCDNCSSLALATVDDAPLCAECMMAALALADQQNEPAEIMPLQIQLRDSIEKSISVLSKKELIS